MEIKKQRLCDRLYKEFLRRLKNNHLEEMAKQSQLSDYEVLRFRKIYEDYQGKLVKAHFIPGH